MIILGIESTCDETAAALVEDGRHLLSNVISTSVKEQALYGGVVPEIASRRHCEFISATVKKALLDAGKTIDDVDAVAVTFAPGLIGAVLVGVNFAKGLAYSAGKPLVPVHHLRGHKMCIRDRRWAICSSATSSTSRALARLGIRACTRPLPCSKRASWASAPSA